MVQSGVQAGNSLGCALLSAGTAVIREMCTPLGACVYYRS